ncbi:hypothetical protein HK103_007572 [Boothiomyces macroporosus]|uniref:Uncharacterized protein n=1 Tax=Boothiomyces macroporosus TaxID=261099 RepID=A0AAD5UCB9_9FUNG|nr:hypothetical protein HK103_007572 [Boothiomyces macroporosus]
MPPAIPDSAPFVNGDNPSLPFIDPTNLHPHIMGILGLPIQGQVLQIVKSMTHTPQPKKKLMEGLFDDEEEELANPAEKKGACPKCNGAGFKHESSMKHKGKAADKCKHCNTCKGCGGSGKVVGKKACSNCYMRGFVHTSVDRAHDAPEDFRCFFCKDCGVCGGIGLEPI